MKFHEVANIFPMMPQSELDKLAADIKSNGLHEPIWIDKEDGQIIDGRNRYLACEKAGVRPSYRVWDGVGSLVAFVVGLNLHRRHLDESQRAMVASRVATLGDGQRRDRQAAQICAPTQAEAADMLSVSRRSVQTAREVLGKGTPELVEAVERGKVSVSLAADLADEPKDVQREIVARGEKEILAAAKEIRARNCHVSHNSGEVEWYTPTEYVEAARKVMHGIDLDPASCLKANETVQAKLYYSKDNNGLEKDWSGRVWMNPPYAKGEVDAFAAKLASEIRVKKVSEACVLVNNATETEWFRSLSDVASAVCFPWSRIKFLDRDGRPVGSPLQGQAVIYAGPNTDRFVSEFSSFGDCWVKP